MAEREKLFNELKKLNSVAESDQKLVQSSLNQIKKKNLKFSYMSDFLSINGSLSQSSFFKIKKK